MHYCVKIHLFIILFLIFSVEKASSLPSDGVAGHNDWGGMTSKIKYDLGSDLRDEIDRVFENLGNFQDFISSDDVAEDDRIGGGMMGFRRFYDHIKRNGLPGFESAKDRAMDLYKSVVEDYCNQGVGRAPGFKKTTNEKLELMLHLLQDMPVLVHSPIRPYGGEGFEEYVKDNWKRWQDEAVMRYDNDPNIEELISTQGSLPDEGKSVKDPNGPAYYNRIEDYLDDSMSRYPYE